MDTRPVTPATIKSDIDGPTQIPRNVTNHRDDAGPNLQKGTNNNSSNVAPAVVKSDQQELMESSSSDSEDTESSDDEMDEDNTDEYDSQYDDDEEDELMQECKRLTARNPSQQKGHHHNSPGENSADSTDDENNSVIVLSSDDEPELRVPNGEYGLRDRAADTTTVKEESESDTDAGQPLKKFKMIGNPEPQPEVIVTPKEQRRVRNTSRIVAKLRKKPELMEDYFDCFVDGDAIKLKGSVKVEDDLIGFFKLAGRAIERLTLNYWEWPGPSREGAFNLIRILKKRCRHLSALNLIGHGEVTTRRVKKLSLPNLNELCFTSNVSKGSKDAFLRLLESIIKGAVNISSIHYSYSTLEDDVDKINELLRKLSHEGFLQNLKSLMFKPEADAKDQDLLEKQITVLAGMKLKKLEVLKFGNNLTQVHLPIFANMLQKFSKRLTRVHILGSLKIDSFQAAKCGFTVFVAMMDHLTYLSFGGSYEFQSIIQSRTASTINETTDLEKEKAELDVAKLFFRFPQMRSLKTLILGNLCTIDKLDFDNFPKLEVFRVGGPWNIGFEFMTAPPCLTVKELQFPDALKDPSLASVIPRVFPNVKKLWIYLPSCKSMTAFFTAAQQHEFKVEELYLKTQFDFECTLEACLLGGRVFSTWADIEKMKRLREYKHYKEFLEHYNIEVPEEEEGDASGEDGEGSDEDGEGSDDDGTASGEDGEGSGEDGEGVEDGEGSDEDGSDGDGEDGGNEVVAEAAAASAPAAPNPGIRVLKYLKALQMEHIPRVLRIPKGDLYWHDTRCQFTQETIGFEEYPLEEKWAKKLPIEALKNFETDEDFECMGRQKRLKEVGLVEYSGHFSHSGYSTAYRRETYGSSSDDGEPDDMKDDESDDSDDDYAKPKNDKKNKKKAYAVKVKPGSLRLAEFTKKHERN